jgi:exoribonuclease R
MDERLHHGVLRRPAAVAESISTCAEKSLEAIVNKMCLRDIQNRDLKCRGVHHEGLALFRVGIAFHLGKDV